MLFSLLSTPFILKQHNIEERKELKQGHGKDTVVPSKQVLMCEIVVLDRFLPRPKFTKPLKYYHFNMTKSKPLKITFYNSFVLLSI